MQPLSIGVVVAALVAFAPLLLKLLDFLKLVKAKDWSATITQLLAFVGGIGVAFAVVHSDFARGTALDHLNVYSVIIAGLILGAGGSTVYDFKRALDNADTAAMPQLLSSARRRVPIHDTVPPAAEPGVTTAAAAPKRRR